MSSLVQKPNRLGPRMRLAGLTDRLQALVLVTGVAIIALLWAGLLYHLHLRETAVREQTHRDVANLALGVEKHVERLLVGVDQVMHFIADDFARDPETFDFAAWLQRATSLKGIAQRVSLFDEKGELVAPRGPPTREPPRFNIQDRAYFLALQASAERGLYIDRTLKGRITGRHVLQTARRLSHRDGSFAGVIVASIDPDYLAEQFKAIDVGAHGSVAVFGHDGFIRARHPQSAGMYERDVTSLGAERGVFAHLRESASGTYEATSAFDHVARIFGYRTVGALPLIVTVGKSLDEVMAPLAAERGRAIMAGAAVTLVLCGLLFLLTRGLERARLHRLTLADKEAAATTAEAQAREANRLLTLAAQIAHIGHWRISLPENELAWSDEVFAIFGRDPAMGAPTVAEAISVYHPDDRTRVEQSVVAAVQEGRGYVFSARIQHTDGSMRDVVSRGVCEVDAAGATTAVFGTIMDVSDLRRAERAVIESEARYRMLAENTSELIMLGHDDGRRSYISPASQRLLGFAPEELAAMRLRDYVHPDDLQRLYAATHSLAGEDGAEIACEYRALHKQRGWIWVEGVFRRVPEATGDAPTIVATFRDVSERREQALALEEAKREADRASAAKTDFLATMSHEIRTPLNAIIGFTDLLAASGRLPVDLQRYAELVRSSGDALLMIVNDILDFSKIEAGAIELHAEAFPPRALIDNCVSIVRGLAAGKGLAIRTAIDAELPPGLLGDEARLRQILLNLLNNAVKFTPAGEIKLAVRHEGRTGCGERLRFSVTDTGIGIASEQQPRLFQRFSQVDGTSQRGFGGTGLGLAICKRLVELMGGEIGVTSQEGTGSTFWFTITLPPIATPSLVPATDAPTARRPGHLLLVEDVAINQELARAVLVAAGHAVDVVGDGAAAVRAVADGSYDLVLMDVQMPGMDGLTATRLIRSLPGPAAQVPLIAMTANVLPDQVRSFREAGMNDHVGKPFHRVELCTTIDRWLPDASTAPEQAAVLEAPDAFDRAIYDEVAAVLPRPRMVAALETLVAELGGSIEDATTADDRDGIRATAHRLRSVAGQLGFIALSRAYGDLEDIAEARVTSEGLATFETCLAQVRWERRSAIQVAKNLIAELANVDAVASATAA